jgi:hypothetical protein
MLSFIFLICAGKLSAEDWPHWRGAARDGLSRETSGWDEGHWNMPAGPRKIWEANCGQGSSSPVVVAGRVYVIGWYQGQDTVQCFDLAAGKASWRQSYTSPRYGRHAVGD